MRGRRKTLAVFLLLLLLSAYQWFRSACAGVDCEAVASNLTVALAGVGGLVLFVWLAALLFRYHNYARAVRDGAFSVVPERYDRSVITLVGKVDRVLDEGVAQPKKGFFSRKDTQAESPRSSSRLRFLVTSPQLKKGERLLIVHRVSEATVRLAPGAWLEVRGVYEHSIDFGHSAGARTRPLYGRVSKTEPPHGFLRVLRAKPELRTRREVSVEKAPAR
jgi:hypothetical protein